MDMKSVLNKLRKAEGNGCEAESDGGLVSILKQLHDELDAAVFEAYEWPGDLTDEQILEKLVALNHKQAQEEKRGIVRYLRPEFQKKQAQESRSRKQVASSR